MEDINRLSNSSTEGEFCSNIEENGSDEMNGNYDHYDTLDNLEEHNENEGDYENLLDVTYIHEDDQPETYDGVEEDVQDNEVDDLASAIALKRNLSATFEKHAKSSEVVQVNIIDNSSGNKKVKRNKDISKQVKKTHTDKSSNVKARIQAFENNNVIVKPKANTQKVRFDQSNRPPTAPVPHKISIAKSGNKKGSSDVPLLSVFLRIRPPSASEQSIEKDDTAGENTVEVLTSSNSNEQASTCIRTYPPLQSNASKVVRGKHHLHSTSHNTDLIFGGNNANGSDGAVNGVKEFNFNRIFGIKSPQEEIFKHIAIPLVDGLFPNDNIKIVGDKLVGKSALLFSYGITNAGKTYTIMGNESNAQSCPAEIERSHGVIPRAIDRMLAKIKSIDSDDVRYQLNLSYLEIYNEQIYDLLTDKNQCNDSKRIHHGPGSLHVEQNALKIRESRNGRVHVKGLAKHQIKSLGGGLELVSKAKSRRHTSSNSINSDSSRSHSICQFEIVAIPARLNEMREADNVSINSSKGYGTDDDSSVQSKKMKKRSVTFWVVDLAGSERTKRTGAFSRSTRQKEASLINSSLMKLMRCLQTLKNNQSSKNNSTSVVPFRESKLTQLFAEHLTGAAASRTSMVVNINPSIADFDETQHVLSYATVAKSIRISESDYNRKRQAIQMSGNNRNRKAAKSDKESNIEKSPPRKIARLAKKLSPRAALARMKESQKAGKQKRKNDVNSLRVRKKPKESFSPKKGIVKVKVKRKKLEEDIEELQTILDGATREAKRYKKEIVSLQGKLVNCESRVRNEMLEETENYHRCVNEQHNEIVNRLKQQLVAQRQTPSKSAKKVQRDKADAILDELMDKVDECEEEMDRMTKGHEERIAAMEEAHSVELSKKDEEIKSLQVTLREKIAHQSCEESVDSESLLEDQENDDEKENSVDHQRNGPSPRLRRLPRQRCSEVACANISPPTKKQPSSATKQRKGLSSMRSPFKNTKTLSKKIKASKTPSKDLIYPSVETAIVPVTGLYQRPKGRAPSGRIWDAKEGAWRVSRSVSRIR